MLHVLYSPCTLEGSSDGVKAWWKRSSHMENMTYDGSEHAATNKEVTCSTDGYRTTCPSCGVTRRVPSFTARKVDACLRF